MVILVKMMQEDRGKTYTISQAFLSFSAKY